ncbi:glycosyltransferase family 4 protein [Motilibacter deserti]|uniref:Glycosyltransferase family 4 protein n=1 Tax=Motilibacter deserti TaxID=2714956 RepID=A0ABX0GWE4_9ACTN|nr:glycosyltransferase family 4 protein [Motilibacter deserti]
MNSGAADEGRPLRVLYSFPHTWGAPGIGTTAYGQVTALARQGHEITLVTTATARPVPPGVRVVRTLSAGGLRLPHRALGGVERALAYHDAVATALLLGRRRYDVVHTWPLGALRTLRAARDKGVVGFREVPNCHTEHAYAVVARLGEELHLPAQPGHSHAYDERRLRREEREYAAAARLLVPSPFVEQTFLDRGFAPAVLARHRYGFDPARVPATPPRGRREGGLRALFLGRCEPRKGLHVALAAWRASQASRAGSLTIAGGFVPGYAEALAVDLAQPGVRAVGVVGDVSGLLADADVLLLPSYEEGSALVTYEAQAAGAVPLVSAAAGAYLEHGVSGLVHEVGDVGGLTGHLDLLHADRGRLLELAQAAQRRRDDLTWDAAADVLARRYGEAVG